MIETPRLRLIPATIALAKAEIGDPREFAGLLGASVATNWPPDSLVDALPLFLRWLEAAPDRVGWFNWYALAKDGGTPPVLIGSGGFKGPPQNGVVEIGYSVLDQFQGRGYAKELIGGLVRWAIRQPGVDRVVAETDWANRPSARALQRSGFRLCDLMATGDGARFEYLSDS
jgi:RimJ/RimL family protein N-acetyltransferase